MSDSEQALLTQQLIDECKSAKSLLTNLRTKSRSIGMALERVGKLLQYAIPDPERLGPHDVIFVNPNTNVVQLAREITEAHERVTFLEKELRNKGISLVD